MLGLHDVLHIQYLLSLHIAAEIYSIRSLLVTSAPSIIQMARHQFLTVCLRSVLCNSMCGGLWCMQWHLDHFFLSVSVFLSVIILLTVFLSLPHKILN